MIQNILVGLLVIGLGVLLLLRGYTLFRILLPIWAFIVGFGGVVSIVSAIFGQNFFSTALACLPALVVGLVFAGLSYFFYTVAIVILGWSVGYALGAGLMSALGLDFWLISCPVGILGGIIGLVFALVGNLRKYLPIVFTAMAGATAIVGGALILFGQRSLDQLQGQGWFGPIEGTSWLAVLAWLVLAAIGIYLQVVSNNRQITYDAAVAWGSTR
jgi:hypothetical protein